MCARSDKVTNSSLFKHIVIILQQARHSMHTHAHTCVFDFTVQRTGEKIIIYILKKKIPLPQVCTYTPSANKSLLPNSLHQQSPTFSQTLSFQSSYCTDNVVSAFQWEEWSEKREGGGGSRDYKSLIFSHRIYTCTHDFNAHLQTFVSLHTRTLTQTICNIKRFKKYR